MLSVLKHEKDSTDPNMENLSVIEENARGITESSVTKHTFKFENL